VTDAITEAAPTGPYFLDLDLSVGKIYWGDFDGGSIYRANLDGSDRETLLIGINKTRGVRIDPGCGMLFWVNRDDGKIQRGPLSAFVSGTIPVTHPAVQALYSDLDTPHGLVLDVAARKIYWADTGTNAGHGGGAHAVNRGDFDGSTPSEVLAIGVEPWDVDLDLRCGSYAEWRTRFFRRDALAVQSDPNSDPDGDGLPNALEYAYGCPPLQADPTQSPEGFLWRDPASGSRFPALKFRRQNSATDLTYHVQVSTDLKDWEGDPASTHTIQIEAVSAGDGIVQVTVRSRQILSRDTAQFMKLTVELRP
jgi:hypothetical protein